MPSSRHEDILEILRKNPETIARLLALGGVEVPDGAVPEPKDADFTERIALEFRADMVVLFGQPKPTLVSTSRSAVRAIAATPWSW